MSDIAELDAHWTKIAQKQLVGRKIRSVRYMTNEERDQLGWFRRPVIIELDNGHLIWPSADDEGNDGGAIFTTDERQPILPVAR